MSCSWVLGYGLEYLRRESDGQAMDRRVTARQGRLRITSQLEPAFAGAPIKKLPNLYIYSVIPSIHITKPAIYAPTPDWRARRGGRLSTPC